MLHATPNDGADGFADAATDRRRQGPKHAVDRIPREPERWRISSHSPGLFKKIAPEGRGGEAEKCKKIASWNKPGLWEGRG